MFRHTEINFKAFGKEECVTVFKIAIEVLQKNIQTWGFHANYPIMNIKIY